jgi:phage gpG-like protein
MLQFTFDFDPEPLDQALEGFQRSLADSSPSLAQIADDFREMIQEQFSSAGRAGDTPWADWAPSTLARRRGPGSGILYSTGALLQSLIDPAAFGHVEEFDGESLTIGSSLPYALFHQTGTGRGTGQSWLPAGRGLGRGMPMRPIIAVTPERTERWLEMLQGMLEEKTSILGSAELGGA